VGPRSLFLRNKKMKKRNPSPLLRRNNKNLRRRTLTMALKLSTNSRPSNCFLPTIPQKLTPPSN